MEQAGNRGEVHSALAWKTLVYPRPNGAVSHAKVWAHNLLAQELPGHLTNQTSEVCRDSRPNHLRLPLPERPESFTVPASQGFRLNNSQCVLPIEKPGEGYQSESDRRIKSTWFFASLLIHGKLLLNMKVVC